jgi:hypothetical protein
MDDDVHVGGDATIGPGSNETAMGPTVGNVDAHRPPATEIPKLLLGSGGAWGAGAVPGSLLARLMEEQENGAGEPDAAKPEVVTRSDDPRYWSSKGVKKDVDHIPRRGSDMDSDTHSNHHRDNDDYHMTEDHDYYSGGGGSRHRSYLPPGDAYINFPLSTGFQGGGGGERAPRGRRGGRGGSFPMRGGRGHHDSGGRGVAPDFFYPDAPAPSSGGWKRSRSGGDSKRRH